MYTPQLPKTGFGLGLLSFYTGSVYGHLLFLWFAVLACLLVLGFYRLIKNERKIKRFILGECGKLYGKQLYQKEDVNREVENRGCRVTPN